MRASIKAAREGQRCQGEETGHLHKSIEEGDLCAERSQCSCCRLSQTHGAERIEACIYVQNVETERRATPYMLRVGGERRAAPHGSAAPYAANKGEINCCRILDRSA